MTMSDAIYQRLASPDTVIEIKKGKASLPYGVYLITDATDALWQTRPHIYWIRQPANQTVFNQGELSPIISLPTTEDMPIHSLAWLTAKLEELLNSVEMLDFLECAARKTARANGRKQ